MNEGKLRPKAGLAGLGALALTLLIGWAYAPILEHAFVWDDASNLVAARPQWERGWQGMVWAFSEPFAGHYQPLTWLSYQLDVLLSGATPRGVHGTQIVLHLLVTLTVALLARELAATPRLRRHEAFQGTSFPMLAAALFGLAPIRVESVAWATERRDLLGTLLTLAAVWLYLRRCRAGADQQEAGLRGSPSPSLFGVAFLAALAALARAQMSLPFVLLLLDVWPLGRLSREGSSRLGDFGRLLREKWLLFLIAAASAFAAIWAQQSSGALTSAAEHGLPARLVQAFYGIAFYPFAALRPGGVWPLLPLYERPVPFPFSAAEYLLPALAGGSLLLVVFLLRRRARALAIAVGAYLLLVLPVLGIAQSGIQLVADRYAYLATTPLVLLLAGVFAVGLQSKIPLRVELKVALRVALLLLLLANTLATHRQVKVWQDDFSLWRHVLAHSESSLADNNLGQLLGARGEAGAALFHLTRCLEHTPQYGRPWRALAALLEAPSPPGAPPAPWVATTLTHALTYQPQSTTARYATALALLRSGDELQAENEFRRLLAIDPDHDGARLALARLAAHPP